MPLLDFQCKKCGKKFDELVWNNNTEDIKCPDCQSMDIKRIYEGKSYFGCSGSSSGSGGCSKGSCAGCSGCH